MDQYTDHLLGEVIGDRKIITYRQLSRSLTVHVSVAKEMLYDFYTSQNSKQPNTVHANYLLTGYREEEKKEKDGGDSFMESSPFDATQQSDKALVRCVVVVPQEKLKESKAGFSQLSSIHIYSLQPTKLADLHIVSAAAQEVLQGVNGEEAKELGQVYGTISNSEAKLRSQRAVMLQTPLQAPEKTAAATVTTAPAETKKPETKKTNSLASAFAKRPEPNEKAAKKEKPTEEKAEPVLEKVETAATKKTQKAFFSNWNAASQKAKEKKENSQASAAIPSPPAEPKDEKMESDSEPDEPEEPAPPARDMDEDIRKRKAKRDAIEAMMDMSDEEKTPPMKKAASPTQVKSESPEPPPTSGQPGKGKVTKKITKDDEGYLAVKMETSRRRSKRKVTKRITSKDNEGYLVVKLESVWESYSEDEPDLPKPKAKATPAAASVKKGKKPTGQQVTLKSFFQKT